MTDAVLFNKWQSDRDAEAFRELASRYSGMVYATCLRVLRNPQEAEEAAQECFEKLAGSPHIASPCLGPWLHKVATNRALDRLRTEGRRRAREDRYALDRPLTHAPAWDDIYPLVDEAIAELPEELRVPLVSHFLENRTHESIAQELGLGRPTITHRIERALERVRLSLKRRGVEVAGAALAVMLSEKMAEAAVVPVALEAALGRLAMAGLKAAPTAVDGASALVGGLTAKVLLGAAAAVVAAGFAWHALVPKTAVPPAARNAEAAQPAASHRSAPTTQPGGSHGGSALAAATSAQAVQEGGVITGRVYDGKTGKGVAGMHVYAAHAWDNGADPALTGTDGVYRITGLAAGTYRVTPGVPVAGYSGRGFRKIETTVTLGKPVEGIDFAMTPSIPVSGRVVSADGKPVPDAHVGVVINGVPAAETAQSRADGTFTVGMPELGTNVQIQAKLEGFQSPVERRESLGAEGIDGVELALTEPLASSIQGKLLLPDGRPAAGYPLHLNSGMTAFLVGISDAVTRADGTFTIDKLAAGTYDVIFSRPGEKRWSVSNTVGNVTVEAGKNLTGLALSIQEAQEGLSISGRVVDKSGKGIAGARVITSGKGDSVVATADEQGNFALNGLKESSYYLDAEPGDKLHSRTVVQDVAAGTQGLQIVLDGVGRIEGRVVSARDGEPIPRFETYLCTEAQAESRPNVLLNRQDVNDPDGKFVREQVGIGTQSLTIKAPGFAPIQQAVEVKENQTAGGVEFRLKPAATLTGRVVDESGKPVADVGIYSDSEKAWTSTEEALARSAADGTFSMEGLPPQVTQVFAYRPQYPPVQVGIDQLDPIVLPNGGAVEGRVTLNGEPVDGCQISAVFPRRFNYAVSKPDGTYRLDAIAPGTTTVTAWLVGPSGRTARQEVTIEAGGTATLNFDFPNTDASVEGTASFAGAPIANAYLTMTVESEGHKETLHCQTDATGHYAFTNIPSGHVMLMLLEAQPGQQTILRRAEFEVTAGATVQHDIQADAPGKISGKVADLSAESTGVVVLLAPDAPLPANMDQAAFQEMVEQHALGIVGCEADGTFEMKQVAPGDYTVLLIVAPKANPQTFTTARMESGTVHVDDGPVTVNLVPR